MSNVFRADFYRRKVVPGLEKVTVKQKFGNHTLALLDYSITSHRDYLLPPEGTPVSVILGKGPIGLRTTYGYVNHYETIAAESNVAYTRMVVLGTSKAMNSTNPTLWSGQTRSGMAREVAARYRLRSVMHQHPEVVDNWATGSMTDFQALNLLGREAGYKVWVDGATAWFIDPSQVVRTASSMTTPYVRTKNQRTIRVLGGSYIPGDVEKSTRRVQFGVDVRTNEVFQATSGDPSQPVELVEGSVGTFREAQYQADAADLLQQDQYVLKGVLEGDATLTPGRVAEFEASKINTDQVGLWLISEATHEISRDDFLTRVTGTRGAEVISKARVPNTIRDSSANVSAIVRNGMTWEATLQEKIYA